MPPTRTPSSVSRTFLLLLNKKSKVEEGYVQYSCTVYGVFAYSLSIHEYIRENIRRFLECIQVSNTSPALVFELEFLLLKSQYS